MYSRRPAALTRPEAGIRHGRRPAALARTHAGIRYGRRLAALARPHAGAMYSRRPAALTLPHGGRPEAGIRCGRSSYPASIVCLRAKHGSRPKYAFGERIHARKAWFETKVCIRRENPCTQSMVRDQSVHSEREFMHAGHASCLHSCARSAGVGWGWEGG